mmetsp:Transcript_10254/g.23966  ORF Transcript_10254/g.23966 Transcript_10254/m.23966 type:complete len:265 (-) Transcript_10254:138-932(-)
MVNVFSGVATHAMHSTLLLSAFELHEPPVLDFDALIVRSSSGGCDDGFGRSSSAPSRTSSLMGGPYSSADASHKPTEDPPKASPKNPMHRSFDCCDPYVIPALQPEATTFAPQAYLQHQRPLPPLLPPSSTANPPAPAPPAPAHRRPLPAPLTGGASAAHGDRDPEQPWGPSFEELSLVSLADSSTEGGRNRDGGRVIVLRTQDTAYGSQGKLQSPMGEVGDDGEEGVAFLFVSDSLDQALARARELAATRNAFVRSVGGDLMW